MKMSLCRWVFMSLLACIVLSSAAQSVKTEASVRPAASSFTFVHRDKVARPVADAALKNGFATMAALASPDQGKHSAPALDRISPENMSGMYLQRAWADYVGHYASGDSVMVEFPAADSITISNLQGYHVTVGGHVDWATGMVVFQPQFFMSILVTEEDEEGNMVEIPYDLTFSGDTASYAPVVGMITESGELVLDRWVCLIYFGEDELGEIWDYPIGLCMEFTQLVRPNASMKVTDISGKEHLYRTRVDYVDESRVALTNFAGKAVIFADLRPEGVVSVAPVQPFYFLNFFYGYASLYYAIYTEDGKLSNISEYRNIYGAGTTSSISFDPWAVCCGTKTSCPRLEWLAVSSSLELYPDAGVELVYPAPSDYGWVGAGTESSPYLLEDAADMEKLASLVEGGNFFDQVYFKITRDIDFTGSSFQGIATGMIRESALHFDGHLDGDGHKLMNLSIAGLKYNPTTGLPNMNTDDENPSQSYIGLIGELRGSVSNLVIDASCFFSGYRYVGSVAGMSKTTLDAKIINCRNFASVVGADSNIGGIIGQTGLGHLIQDCYNGGTVIGGDCYIGGIVGYLFRTEVRGCQNSGDVFQDDEYRASVVGSRNKVGGIAGFCCGSTVKHSLNTGTVSGLEQVGGIIGCVFDAIFPTTVDSTLTVGALLCPSAKTCGAVYGYVSSGTHRSVSTVYDGQMRPTGAQMDGDLAGTTALSTAELTSGNVAQLDPRYWSQSVGRYPILKNFAGCSTDWAYNYISFADGEDAQNVKSATAPLRKEVSGVLLNGDDFKLVTGEAGTYLEAPELSTFIVYDTLMLTYGNHTTLVPLRAMPPLVMQGSGTEEDPYLINSVDEFIAFAEFTNIYNESYEGKHIRLTRLLDFKNKKYVIPYSNGQNQFLGTFDGNGKTFNNVSLALGNTGESANMNKGLFGVVGATGKIKNLGVNNSQISGYSSIGALVGILYGTLENCMTTATTSVRTHSRLAGGLVGIMKAGSSIVDCINRASVYSVQFCGGIAAEADDGDIQILRTKNYGHVYNNEEGRSFVSNIAGFVPRFCGVMKDCANYGEIESGDDYAAGFVCNALNGAVFEDCINYGPITTHSENLISGYAAGICSMTTSTIPVRFVRCGNVGTIHAKFNYAGGISALAEAEFVDCWNMGTIIIGNVFGGGVAGYATSPLTSFLRCWNTGDVLLGEISKWGWHAGGIIGNTDDACIRLDQCWNGGHVEVFREIDEDNEDYPEYFYTAAGGLVGYGNAQINDCYNVGFVASKKDVGGLIGMPGEEASGHRCWNGGVVSNFDDNTYAGNAIGSTHFYGSDFTDIYYDTDAIIWPYELDKWYVGVPRARLTSADMASSLGDKFDCTAEAAYPQLKAFALDESETNAFAILAQQSAAVSCATYLLSGDDTEESVTKPIRLGLSDVVIWEGEGFTVSEDGYAFPTRLGDASLIVSMDGTAYTKTFQFTITSISGIETIRQGETGQKNVPVYDLYGRSIDARNMEKGRLYLQGGKKVLGL